MHSADKSQSVWSLLVEHVPKAELPAVQAALGCSLVDMYTEAYSEMEMWQGIWQRIQRDGNHGNRAGSQPALPDPPAIKELLRAEIQMLLQSVRERASREGRDAEEVLLRYDSDTVNYAMCYPNNCPSNCSYPGNCSCFGNTNLIQHGNRSTSRCSVQSSVHDEIEAVQDKLNVTDINQVVAHLRSVLMQECQALKSQVKHIQETIQQKCSSQCKDKTEPTISELREQRRIIQMDLELPTPQLISFPSSSSTSSSSSSSLSLMEDLNKRSSLSAGQKTLRPLTPTPFQRPHPPPPLSHTKPSRPVSATLTKPSASRRLIRTSALARTQGQHDSKPTFTEPSITQTPGSHRITSEGPESAPFTASRPRHGSEQLITKSNIYCVPFPEKKSLDFCCYRTLSPSIQTESKRNLSSSGRSLSLSSEFVLPPQTERKGSPLLLQRSRHTTDSPSPIPPLSPLRDAKSHQLSYSSNEHSVSATVTPQTQIPEGVICQFPADNTNSDPVISGSQTQDTCTQPASPQMDGQSFSFPTAWLGTTSQPIRGKAQTGRECLNMYFQPFPPAIPKLYSRGQPVTSQLGLLQGDSYLGL
ncbi:coiled-coil domain-containing protein 24 [Myripristis murdjan]|uniref:Coiled-coil domain containing 24 n=1 Tax=Myripristis murdjan TaxID=586833 RepID=A0A667YF96_9TELE|nr:coiled-coil domain-containing protein 24 [Myripristis murdjan]XP_029931227.1 coiled-coil domain-containing protein 24 [Myripristis murdjan]